MAGDAHYNKALGQDVPTPHSHTYINNVNPNTGEVASISKAKDKMLDGNPLSISDLRLIDRYLKKQGK